MTDEIELVLKDIPIAHYAKAAAVPEPGRLDLIIEQTELVDAVAALIEAKWGYLSAMTGLDLGPKDGRMEVLYHFCRGPEILTLRVVTFRNDAHVPTISHIIPSASLFERELMETLGVQVIGTPDPRRLFLPDDWPAGSYPLRKDYVHVPLDDAYVKTVHGPDEDDSGDKFLIPIGPQHPALKEPGHFEFSLDGETVTGASVRLGYVHRGIEKGCEERNWAQCLYLLERICGICSHSHAYAYSNGVERLAGVEAPPRAQAIRVLVAGLERIHSHLLWLGVSAHEAGFDTLFMFSWRDREVVMDLLEKITGNRVNYSVNILGGVKYDLNDALIRDLREGIKFLDDRTNHYLDVVTKDAAFLQRTRGVGVLSTRDVERLGLVGPMARASGVARDVRVEAPYGGYNQYLVSMVRETAGDLEAKFVIRINELFVTYSAILSILDHLPGGDLAVRIPRKIPAGETISRVEAPRGELFYFIKSAGGEGPERVHVRTPSISNFASIASLVVGHQMADVPLILASIDPCFSCNDR